MNEAVLKKMISALERDLKIAKKEIKNLKIDKTKRLKELEKPLANSGNDVLNIARESFEEYYNVNLKIRTRRREVCKARQEYYHWLRYNTNLSLREIGNSCELHQDHSTVLHAIQVVDDIFRIKESDSPDYINIVSIIKNKLNEN